LQTYLDPRIQALPAIAGKITLLKQTTALQLHQTYHISER